MTHSEIIGRTFEFAYSNESYRIEILSETQVRWTRTRGENSGAGDTEAYVYSVLTGSVGLITWIEADGLGLSNVLKFETGEIITHANQGREVFRNPGRLNVQ